MDELVKNADIAMYEAKKIGKNQFVICTKDIRQGIHETIDMSSRLYHALEREEFIDKLDCIVQQGDWHCTPMTAREVEGYLSKKQS